MKKKFLYFCNLIVRALKPPRSLRFTKTGSAVVFLTIGIGLAAMNTGNNLVYMIFGMMLGFITASGIISEISLRGLEVDWIFPAEIYAEHPATIRLLLRNTKKKLPSFGISIQTFIRAAEDGLHPNDRKEPGSLSPTSPRNSLLQEALCLFVAAKSQISFDVQFVPEKRGRYLIDRIKIETKFPFGFFRKYLTRFVEKDFIVFPKLQPIEPIKLFQISRDVRQTLPWKGTGDSFWGIKHFSEGDNPRLISWKSTAKQSKLMVRETEKETEKKVCLTMEPIELWKNLQPQELESAISFAASFILEKFKESFAIGFIAPGLVIQPSQNKNAIPKIFSYLALFNRQMTEKNVKEIKRGWDVGEEIVGIHSLWKQYGS